MKKWFMEITVGTGLTGLGKEKGRRIAGLRGLRRLGKVQDGESRKFCNPEILSTQLQDTSVSVLTDIIR